MSSSADTVRRDMVLRRWRANKPARNGEEAGTARREQTDTGGSKERSCWTDEELAAAAGRAGVLSHVIESLDMSRVSGMSDAVEFIGGHMSPSQAFDREGRQAAVGNNSVYRAATTVAEFWRTGCMFTNVDEDIHITRRRIQLMDDRLEIHLSVEGSDDRRAEVFRTGKDSSVWVLYRSTTDVPRQ
jgi:hypothetical protein